MSISARALAPEDNYQWDQFVLHHPHGSPFHQIGWKRSIEQTFGYKPLYLLAEDNGRIQGVLPLFLVRNPLMGKVLISSPFAVYGGVLASSALAKNALRDKIVSVARAMRVGYVELRNSHPEQAAGFSPLHRYVTFHRDISTSEDDILAAIPRKTRRMVRKALQYNFSTRRSRETAIFFDLYSRSLRRLGTPCFPRRHFDTLLKNFPRQVDIREVMLDGKVVAAAMTFYFRDQVLPYYGTSNPRYNAFAPNNFMYFDLMRWGNNEGYRVFDFGRSKKESGSFDFKGHWGMSIRELPYEVLLVNRKQLPDYSPNNPRFQFAIRLWRRLPLRVTQAIGPRLIKLVP